MRAVTVFMVLLASGAQSLCAQHGGQIEMGGFAAYTRYDSRFQLGNQLGAGAFLGYFLGDHFSLEVDGLVAQPRLVSGAGTPTAAFASASLVLSSGALYLLGGYSRLHIGPGTPDASDLNAIHTGLGARAFFPGEHGALRFEVRAYYRGPGASFNSQDEIIHVTGTVGLSLFVGPGGEKSRRY